jgi:TorA maturation chaperone TorD
MFQSDRADVYALLAELLAEPPDWMSLPGREWPLFELAANLLHGSPALLGLSTLPAEARLERLARYNALFGNAGRPRFWLHESGYLNGRIVGEETFAVARFYREAKLTVNGAELPDHASFELAFLAYLAEHGDLQTEQRFLNEHALRWLPALGHSLSSCDDPLYATVGQLLADFLEWVSAPSVPEVAGNSELQMPLLVASQSCMLCGFCVQRCPTDALFVYETGTHTSLMLVAEKCNGCEKCIPACPDKLLTLATASDHQQTHTLLESERVVCSACGAPTVSRAEFNYMIQKIGHPAWLDMCLACRVSTPHGGVR